MSVELTLYTRTDCHLCEDMQQALSALEDELDFMITIISIENNDELERAYGTRVPVLKLKNKMVCEYFFDRAALDNALAKV